MKSLKKYRWITLSVNNPRQFNTIISSLPECEFYAYIYHDRDVDTPIHLHVVAYSSPRSIKTWSNLFFVPENMIEIVKRPRSICRYLLHLDDKDKFQYSITDVITNNQSKFSSYINSDEYSLNDLYNDLKSVNTYSMPVSEFLNKYENQIKSMGFYNQYKILLDLLKYDYIVDVIKKPN